MKRLLTIVIIITILSTMACMDGGEIQKPDKNELMNYLPTNAVVYNSIGNGWYTVRIGRMIYLAVIQNSSPNRYNIQLTPYASLDIEEKYFPKEQRYLPTGE